MDDIFHKYKIPKNNFNKNIYTIKYLVLLYSSENDVKDLPKNELIDFLNEINLFFKLTTSKYNMNLTYISLLYKLFKIRQQIMIKYNIVFCENYEYKYLADTNWHHTTIIKYEDRYVTKDELQYFYIKKNH